MNDFKNENDELRLRIANLEWGNERTNDGLKALYQELSFKNEQLKKYDQLKSQFVADVSHEYKSPLGIVSGYISIILDGMTGEINDQQKDYLKRSLAAVNRLNRLVIDTLDLSKIESGKMVLHCERFDVNSLVNEILNSHAIIAQKQNISLLSKLEQNPLLIWGDKDKIAQLVNNLISNAIKYTRDNGMATVSLCEDEQNIRFVVEDNGPGIPEEDYDKVFDRFERITTENKEGTGLGLPISKEIAELHKGKLWVESEIGKGSKFIFTLPIDLRNRQA